MNAVDATDRESQSDDGVPPSLLTIVIDTNPHAWALLANELPLQKVVASLLVFINAHLAINNANKVAVIASHTKRAQWLYPSHLSGPTSSSRDNDVDMADAAPAPVEDPNKYRPFAQIEATITSNLRALIAQTEPGDLIKTISTLTAGALTMALAYISKSAMSAGTGPADSSAATSNMAATQGQTARVLIVSVSGDLSSQYIPMMNAIFAAQRMHCPIDILKLSGDTVFLQQAADATGGVYLDLTVTPASDRAAGRNGAHAAARTRAAGLLQYLLLPLLPDPSARAHLYLPGQTSAVDFRAACFCHRRIVDIGFVCSVCLSIFCDSLQGGECLTCGTELGTGDYGRAPVVVRKKKKKKMGGMEKAGTPGGDTETLG